MRERDESVVREGERTHGSIKEKGKKGDPRGPDPIF